MKIPANLPPVLEMGAVSRRRLGLVGFIPITIQGRKLERIFGKPTSHVHKEDFEVSFSIFWMGKILGQAFIIEDNRTQDEYNQPISAWRIYGEADSTAIVLKKYIDAQIAQKRQERHEMRKGLRAMAVLIIMAVMAGCAPAKAFFGGMAGPDDNIRIRDSGGTMVGYLNANDYNAMSRRT